MTEKLEAAKRPNSGIVVHPRQRKEYDQAAIAALAESIRRTGGLLHPIVLDPADDSLVAGGRRRLAYGYLAATYPGEGWELIPFVYKNQQDEISRKVAELEENLARLDLTWWEKANAIAEIDELQRSLAEARGETWNMRKTAEIADASLGQVQQAIALSKAIKEDPSLKESETQQGAAIKLKTQKQLAERKAEIERKKEGSIRTFPAEILVGDSRALIRAEADESFDAIVSNFPFGIEYGYSGKAEKVYEDEEDENIALVRDIVRESYRVLKNDSWLVAFYDIRKITYSNPQLALYNELKNIAVTERTKEMLVKSMGLAFWLEEAGFSYVTLMPYIWAKPNKTTGNLGNPRKGAIVAYEAAVFAAKGDACLLKQGKQDLFIYDTLDPSERDFSMQMPVALCKEIISRVVLGGARVLDPFAGVGSFGEGALENQCEFRGYELNPDRAATGNLRLQEHIFAKESNSDGSNA